jgi:GTPase SAR1 family protein/predicted nucleotidyltransferase
LEGFSFANAYGFKKFNRIVKNKMESRLICIIGADGSGKTTLANRLVNEFRVKGYPAKYVWFRLPYFLTFLILGLSKFLGFTQYKKGYSGIFTQYNFSRQPLKTIYPLIVFTDVLFYYSLKLDIPTKLGINVICDRWVPDIMIDISINTANLKFDQTLLGRAFSKLASKSTLTIAVTASGRTLQKRRPESLLDPNVTVRRNLYRIYMRKYGIANINSDHTITTSYAGMLEIARAGGIEFDRLKKVYTGSMNPWVHPLLMRRSFVLAINWVFQGTLIMTMSERLFRFLLELTVAATSIVLLSHSVPLVQNILLSLVVAHTIDWSLNGNFWATQRFFGRKSDPKQLIDFLRNLEKGEHFSVEAIAAFGSLSRGRFNASSDLDMRIVRKRGFLSWMGTNLFVLKLRSTSFVKRRPVDIFIMDRVDQIYDHISRDEMPIVIYDPKGILWTINDHCILLKDLYPAESS